jgi:hypothetical protein
MTQKPSLLFIFSLVLPAAAIAEAGQPAVAATPPLELKILSSASLNGTAGDFVTVEAQITNVGPSPISDIATYLSLVDMENKLPVDLEDWSAERGFHIGALDSGRTAPLNWKIHFVVPGSYSLVVVAFTPGYEVPRVSTITHFDVKPKQNLNPGQVLPVAIGMPVALALLLLLVGAGRRRKKAK